MSVFGQIRLGDAGVQLVLFFPSAHTVPAQSSGAICPCHPAPPPPNSLLLREKPCFLTHRDGQVIHTIEYILCAVAGAT